MDQSNTARVERYLEMYRDIREQTGDERIALAVLQEVAKDRRMDQMREERELKNGDIATPKQIEFLRKLTPEMVNPGLTKKEASRLIDQARAKS